MKLEGRKLTILNIIIESYMQTGEPVGSRTISKYSQLNISPATVRNEMADLEDMGLIMQPYTSAGRIPTDLGYRIYVDNLLKERYEELYDREKEIEKRENDLITKSKLIEEKYDKIEKLLHNVAVQLADKTNYTTLVTATSSKVRIKFLQLSKIDANRLILVCVTDANMIRNQILEVDKNLFEEEILKLNLVLNTNLTGKFVDQIGLADINIMKKQASIDDEIFSKITDALGKALYSDDEMEIYTGGTSNILRYPELSRTNNFQGLLTEIVEKNELTKFMNEAGASENDIEIYIGNENKISYMNDCSVVTMKFELDKGVKSTVGIIGPKRMDYQKVLDNLENLRYQIRKLFDDE